MKQVRQKAASGLTGGGERARRRLLTPQLYHARQFCQIFPQRPTPVSYTHLRAHETVL